ncbi:hypothetical protein NL676_019121 [Syzygium grande]|nr:hypothetical protein NL676_019121 [Syzygium grande]
MAKVSQPQAKNFEMDDHCKRRRRAETRMSCRGLKQTRLNDFYVRELWGKVNRIRIPLGKVSKCVRDVHVIVGRPLFSPATNPASKGFQSPKLDVRHRLDRNE